MCGWESKDDRWFLTNGEDSDVYGFYGPGSDQTSIQSKLNEYIFMYLFRNHITRQINYHFKLIIVHSPIQNIAINKKGQQNYNVNQFRAVLRTVTMVYTL